MKFAEEIRGILLIGWLLSTSALLAEPPESANSQGRRKHSPALAVVKQFFELDKNNDGFLDVSEKANMKHSDLKSFYNEFDFDKDGRVGLPELRKGIEGKPELKDFRKKFFQKFLKKVEKNLSFSAGEGFTQEEARKKWPPERIEKVFHAFDLNSDAFISPAEAKKLKTSLLAEALSEIIGQYAPYGHLEPSLPGKKKNRSKRKLGFFVDLDGDGAISMPEAVKFVSEACDEETGKFVGTYLSTNAHFSGSPEMSSTSTHLIGETKTLPGRKPEGEPKTGSKPPSMLEPPKSAASPSVKSESPTPPPLPSTQPAGFIISNQGSGSASGRADSAVLKEILGDSPDDTDLW